MKEKKLLFNNRIDQLGAYQSNTDIQDAGTADKQALKVILVQMLLMRLV